MTNPVLRVHDRNNAVAPDLALGRHYLVIC
jgi:hypothetical protein